jgi:hypothetical protein
MKIISYLYIFSLLVNNIVNCYHINKLKNNLISPSYHTERRIIPSRIIKNKSLFRLNSNLNTNIKFVDNNILKNKLIGYLKLIRYKNIFPTIYLFLTGAWIVNPNINILHNKTLLYSLISTLCILMSNMVINDIFDMKLDRINNPLRPLITGDVSVTEANILLIILLSITEYINICILPNELQQIIPGAVGGEPNAVDEDGKPIYQGIDASTPEMIALMIAELQSLRKRVAQLEAK